MPIMIVGESLDGANEYRQNDFALARPSLTMMCGKNLHNSMGEIKIIV
jgi:hypothetical protein